MSVFTPSAFWITRLQLATSQGHYLQVGELADLCRQCLEHVARQLQPLQRRQPPNVGWQLRQVVARQRQLLQLEATMSELKFSGSKLWGRVDKCCVPNVAFQTWAAATHVT